MKKSIVIFTALLLTLARVDSALAGGSCSADRPSYYPSQPSSCTPQCPEECPPAPVCGTDCSLNILSMTIAILAVGGVIAVILSHVPSETPAAHS